ncbi:MAG TPA: FkbM family methyltransferase [Syntrophobacteraceae bacterium]|nr:FkbM family methyltransferase [Syntrophobacteraceae bacterium]
MIGIGVADLFCLREPHLYRIISKYAKLGKTALDIGANVGVFTLCMSRFVGSRGKVFAFEPIPETFEVLKKNVYQNQINNVIVVNKGVSDKHERTVFRISNGNFSMASMHWHCDDENAVQVVAGNVALDQLDELKDENICFIKIDVEGAEGNVMSGMRGLLAGKRPVVFTECSTTGRHQSWDIMTGLGYRCFDAGNVDVRITDFDKYRQSDYVWLP